MFTNKLAESRQTVVAVNGVESAKMALLLKFAYTSTVVINQTNVQSLLSAANLLQVLPVKAAACLFLECHMDTSVEVDITTLIMLELHLYTTLLKTLKYNV
jgi:hypothetical protein